jgi:hypothetical protein
VQLYLGLVAVSDGLDAGRVHASIYNMRTHARINLAPRQDMTDTAVFREQVGNKEVALGAYDVLQFGICHGESSSSDIVNDLARILAQRRGKGGKTTMVSIVQAVVARHFGPWKRGGTGSACAKFFEHEVAM